MTNHRNDRGRRRAGAGLLLAAIALLATMTACKPRPIVRSEVPPVAAPPGASLYRVVGGASTLRFYLHADGPLVRMGHNHVISAHGVEGEVWLEPQPQKSTCQLRLPVAAFVVDDPGERAEAGGEFAEPIKAADRDGTYAHMIGDRQLDAARYQNIWLRCLRMTPTATGMSLDLAVTLRDRETQLTVPLQWELKDGLLQASGEFSFRQSELGLEPYSLMMGALRVADEVHARFTLVARQS